MKPFLYAISTAAALFITASAFAHVEPGTYLGTDQNGKECSMHAGETYFEGKPHPLNERIKITVNGRLFIVGHPPVVDFSQDKVFFNHNAFQSVQATEKGAIAIEIGMMHSESFEGPVNFALVENEWKSGKKISLRCDGIKIQK